VEFLLKKKRAGQDDGILQLTNGDGYTTLQISLIPLNYRWFVRVGGEKIRKGGKRMNVVEILVIYV
jgi:hypothetical protein